MAITAFRSPYGGVNLYFDSDGSTDPSDALIAFDNVADGYGIEATLWIPSSRRTG
ncbi:hypothetical protein PV682_32945 [Streptomyces niveiscabiei]|uniref:hypothetical protein n=1 Tax=Streptomyces niveiscabiei TaxID=164115 RepID=UPI0029BE568D|nr:hypothetical protein [Streptomyces niveiscabiei]MDX3386231.1 hypothetical protein [Streptomyces niveiscabiei]